MAEFPDNNAKNISTNYTPFKLNCGYSQKFLFEKVVDPCSKCHSINKLAEELKKLIELYYYSLFHA